MQHRKDEIRELKREMGWRDRLYWFFCPRWKKEAILDLRRQLDQEMDGQAGGAVHGISQDLENGTPESS